MLYGAKVAICSQINTKHINTVWAECKILECLTCWCIMEPLGFKRLIVRISSMERTDLNSCHFLRISLPLKSIYTFNNTVIK